MSDPSPSFFDDPVLKAALRRTVGQERAPASLRTRMQTLLATEAAKPRAQTRTRNWRNNPLVGLAAAAMLISLGLLGIAMKSLPVGTAYAVWVGVGAVGTVILGIVLFAEPANALRLISVGLIVAGIVGLKLSSPA